MIKSLSVSVVLLLVAHSAAAEQILLPILTPETPGAHGSIWASEVWIHNASDDAITVGGLFPPGASQIPAKTTYGATGSNRNVPGGFISVPDGAGQHLRFNLRVRDLSRQALTWGTQIPVVREAELATTTISLVDIPADERFRETLRIYQLLEPGTAAGAVHLKIYRLRNGSPDPPVYEQTIQLNTAGSLGWAQVGPFGTSVLLGTFPRDPGGTSSVRMDIHPLIAGMRFWAFAAVTNNETQHVTTVAPE